MCGLVGILGGNLSIDELQNRVEKMKTSIRHRGPDDDGMYIDPKKNHLVLGHQRLAIIDPEHGKQPMLSHDQSIAIVFNGAIYNYLELRDELLARGHPVHTFSDTQVLLYAYLEWGEDCVDKLRGMFAFAIWDTRKQRLFCARDRVGIKPFYYHFDGERLLFGSEIKALLASGLVKAEVDQSGLQDYLTFQFCLGNNTLFKNIHKLEPGYCLTADLQDNRASIAIRQYWDVQYNIDEGHDEAYYADNLAALLDEAVTQHLRSDVPLGAHLSGGLDSSTVVSLAAAKLKGVNFKTFTGAFREGPEFDETHYAKIVAEKAGADYHEIYIPGEEFTTVLPKLIYAMDEPLAGPGLIPQYYVSKLAAEHVKVVLGGQGGDELYLGYARYLVAYLEKSLFNAINPEKNNSPYDVSLSSIAPHLPLLKQYMPMMQHFWRDGLFDSDDKRYFRIIDRSENSRELYDPSLFDNSTTFERYQQIFNRKDLHGYINQMTYFDLKASLPALLHVEDRTSMAVSLESRVPLLDHRLVEQMATIPPAIKFANGQTKHIFKQAVKNVVPQEILYRKDKMGFPVPLNQWLQGSASDFVSDILFSDRARQRGIYNIAAIEQSYRNHNKFSRVMWGLLCMELWFREFIDL